MNCFRFSQTSVHRPVLALWWWLGWSQRRFGRWLLLFALLPLAGRTAAAGSDWAAGWTRCPTPSARWVHLGVSSNAAVIAAVGWVPDEESGLVKGFGAVSEDFGRSWRLMSSPREEAWWQQWSFSERTFAVSGDGSSMAIAGSRWSVSPDGTSVSEAVLVTSDDHGTTWSRRAFPAEVARNAEIRDLALSRDGRHILAAVAGVACLSQDRGLTWQVVVPSDGGSISGVAVAADGNTLAVSLQSADEVKLLLSTDTGATWSRLNWHGVGTPRFLTLLEPGDRGLRMAAALEDSLSVSDDQGKSWRDLPMSHMPSAFAVTPDGVQVLSVPPLGAGNKLTYQPCWIFWPGTALLIRYRSGGYAPHSRLVPDQNLGANLLP